MREKVIMANRGKTHRTLNEEEAYNLLLAEESLILNTQMAIQSILNEKQVTQAELARRMGVGESYVSQMLGASARNLTLRTVARVMSALGETAHVTIKRRLEGFSGLDQAFECHSEFGPWGEVVMLEAVSARPIASGWEPAANENECLIAAAQDFAAAA